jgi:hypothetical protein
MTLVTRLSRKEIPKERGLEVKIKVELGHEVLGEEMWSGPGVEEPCVLLELHSGVRQES